MLKDLEMHLVVRKKKFNVTVPNPFSFGTGTK